MRTQKTWIGGALAGMLAVVSFGSSAAVAAEDSTAAGKGVSAAQSQLSPADIIVEKNVMVPMRDGVRLATDIYRPSAPGRYPVVFVRTPYGTELPKIGAQAKYYVAQGYAFAIQDCRGKYESEGDWFGKRDEAKDGSDSITWLGTQPWSTGKVGMTGGSYRGMVQYLVADQENRYLKALVPLVAPTTLGRDLGDFDHLAVYSGRDSLANIIWLIRTDGRIDQNDENFSLTFERAWDHLPRSEYPQVFGRKMEWIDFLLNQRYGFWEEYYLRAAQGEWRKPIQMDAWWKGYEARYRKVNVPMLHVSGWYDCCGEQPIKMFQMVRKYATDPVVKNNQRLMMGPWHHQVGSRKTGDIDFGPSAAMDRDELSARWFDHWLKGRDNGMDKQPAVRVFVMGENRWRDADDWPIPGTRFTKFYLHSKGEARVAQGGGGLSDVAPGKEPVDRYTYDPANPRSIPGSTMEGPADMAAVQRRDDVLVYGTNVLKTAVETTGPLSAVLYVSTSAPSTDFFVRLLDVHPDGKIFPAFITWSSGPFRTHWSKDVETAADGTRIVKAEIMLPPTSILFKPGHRIQVEISSSQEIDGSALGIAKKFGFRGLNVEPGTEATATKWNVARQTIYHDQAHPSHMLLPVIPR